MRCLVTGAAGFIGSHVVRALLARGHAVRALHLPQDDLRNLRGLPCEAIPGDITDPASLRRAVDGCQRVFHLAAVFRLWSADRGLFQRVNVEGTRQVLLAARAAGVERVVVTSSIARFGGQGPQRRATEDSPFALGRTGDAYAQSKRDAHELALSFAGRLDLVLVAPTGPIGPGDVGPTPTGRLLLGAALDPLSVVVASGVEVADVRDMAEGHVLAAERGARGACYLLGGHDVTLAELARLARSLAGQDPRAVLTLPTALLRPAAHAALAWARVRGTPPALTPASLRIAALGLRADPSRARRELGLPVRPLAHAVLDALAWWAQEGYVTDPARRERILARAGLSAWPGASAPRPASPAASATSAR